MATPHVVGAASLLLAQCNVNTADLRTALLNNVQPIASLTSRMATGGRLNVYSALRSCNPNVPSTSATFVGTDTTTQGNWRGVYGTDGYNVINDTVQYPAYAQVTASGQGSWTWVGSTTDGRALQKASGTDRIAATWYGSTFSIDINVIDGTAHRVGLYLSDWDTTQRAETLEVRDAVTNALLDSRTASGFSGGQYWQWTVSGHVIVRIIHTAGANAVVSGLFFN
jgi:hypothetical protein